jgi:hypothetical protein
VSVLHNCNSSSVFNEKQERVGQIERRKSPVRCGRPVSTFPLSNLMKIKINIFNFTFL